MRRDISTSAASVEPKLGCGAAIVIDGQILLLRRMTEPEAGCWGLPGGKVDLFETVQAATEREVREELGLGIEAKELLCLAELIDREAGQHWLAPVFLIRAFEGEPMIVEPGKHDGLAWFSIDAPPNPLTEPTRVALQAIAWRSSVT